MITFLDNIDKEELVSYMMRDQMPFDIDRYPIEKEL